MHRSNNVIASTTLALAAALASAHGGRRLEIIVLPTNQLAAQGYVSTGVDDGGGTTRPYLNAIHGHWANSPIPGDLSATADLPGFDLFTPGPLAGHNLTLTLIGATQWVPTNPADPHSLVQVPMPPQHLVYVGYDTTFHDTASGGTFPFLSPVPAHGADDLDLTYDIAVRPAGFLIALQFILATDAPGIADSGVVSVILSPDGVNGMERMHHAALHLESLLGLSTCPADFNNDGTPGDIFDLFDFLTALDAGLDYNNDSSPADIFDLFDFLSTLDASCP